MDSTAAVTLSPTIAPSNVADTSVSSGVPYHVFDAVLFGLAGIIIILLSILIHIVNRRRLHFLSKHQQSKQKRAIQPKETNEKTGSIFQERADHHNSTDHIPPPPPPPPAAVHPEPAIDGKSAALDALDLPALQPKASSRSVRIMITTPNLSAIPSFVKRLSNGRMKKSDEDYLAELSCNTEDDRVEEFYLDPDYDEKQAPETRGGAPSSPNALSPDSAQRGKRRSTKRRGKGGSSHFAYPANDNGERDESLNDELEVSPRKRSSLRNQLSFRSRKSKRNQLLLNVGENDENLNDDAYSEGPALPMINISGVTPPAVDYEMMSVSQNRLDVEAECHGDDAIMAAKRARPTVGQTAGGSLR